MYIIPVYIYINICFQIKTSAQLLNCSRNQQKGGNIKKYILSYKIKNLVLILKIFDSYQLLYP
jgi:hypothetical protein